MAEIAKSELRLDRTMIAIACVVAAGCLMWWLTPADVLTHRYFNNVFIQQFAGPPALCWVMLVMNAGWLSLRSSLAMAAALGACVAIVAIVINTLGADFLDAFYLIYGLAFCIIGVLLRYIPRLVLKVLRHAFDPQADITNRAFRLGLLACAAILVVVVGGLALFQTLKDSVWREIQSEVWSYGACLCWGLVSAKLIRFQGKPALV
jgi:hypothetical protein